MSIKVKDLTKIYGKQKAIDQISFEINTGEIVGFVGPNGAGKSTTMKILTGFIPPSSGEVKINDLDLFEKSLEIRKHIGYLPENNPLYLDMYVKEYLEEQPEVDNPMVKKLKKEKVNLVQLENPPALPVVML